MADENMNEDEDHKDPVPGSDEYNEMMAAKFRESQEGKDQYPKVDDQDGADDDDQSTDDAPKAPEGVPAKFIKEDGTVDVEALAKSYTELEKNRGKKPDDPPGDGEEADSSGQEAAEKAGMDYQELTNKVVENGDLDEADYERFEKAGVPREMVQEYIALRQAQAEQNMQKAMEYGGGEEATKDLLNWASQNLSPEEIDSYNEMLGGPKWKVAMDTLKTQRSQSKKSANEPKLRTGTQSSSGSSTGYVSRDEMREDMRDPLYRDPGPKGERFRAEVQRKMQFAAWRSK